MHRALCALLIACAVSANGQSTIRQRLPMHFTESADRSFRAHGVDYALSVDGNEAVMVLHDAAVRRTLAGANENPSMRGEHPLAAKSHFFIGNDPSQWRTNVSQYAKVRVIEAYRGIDVLYYGRDEELEYDFIVQPGADPAQIRLRYEGAQRIDLDAAGDLVLQTGGGELRQHAPVVYQTIGGKRRPIRSAYRRIGAFEFAFDLGPYDRTRPLVIDPVLVYSTYLGGTDHDFAFGIAADSAGNAYVTGYTLSSNFPTTAGALQPGKPASGSVAFVTKLNPSGAPVYSTYLGGTFSSHGYAIAVDGAGHAYVTGYTYDDGFPLVNAAQATHGGLTDVFITKLDATGSAILYSTLLGGNTSESGYGIAVDGSGNAIVTGETGSANFPTVNALQASRSGIVDAFVAKLNAAGSAFQYVTFLGGSGAERGLAAAADAAGNAYITGFTTSANFPTASAIQATFGGVEDAFVTKLNPSGSALVHSTYLGGSTFDYGRGISLDASGAAAVTGFTRSPNFPTANALQPVFGGDSDAFVTKLNPAGTALVFSTFFGGSAQDGGTSISMDASANVYFAGLTQSTNFPTANAIQASHGGGVVDAFATALNATASALIYSTYLGGNGLDEASGIDVSPSGVAVLAGSTNSTNYPTMNAFQPAPGGAFDAFVTAIATVDLAIAKTQNGTFVQGQTGTYTITVSNAGLAPSSGTVTVTDTLSAGLTAASLTGTGWSCTLATLTCTRNDALAPGASYPPITLTVDIGAQTTGSVTNTATVSGGGGDPNPANGSTTSVTVISPSVTFPIPTLDPRALAALALLIAAMAMIVLRR